MNKRNLIIHISNCLSICQIVYTFLIGLNIGLKSSFSALFSLKNLAATCKCRENKIPNICSID